MLLFFGEGWIEGGWCFAGDKNPEDPFESCDSLEIPEILEILDGLDCKYFISADSLDDWVIEESLLMGYYRIIQILL